jgi:hypothetical protein
MNRLLHSFKCGARRIAGAFLGLTFGLALVLTFMTSMASMVFMAQPAQAYNHPEREWHVIDTPHFQLYYYAAVSETAAHIAYLAEKIYPQLRERYGRDLPLPVRIVFDDSFDPLNGAAYHDFNMITLEGITSTSDFRGVHNWQVDVLTHELAHLFSLRTSRVLGGLIPGLVVSALDAPSSRPFQIAATLFLPSELSPRWFAEGIAQLDSTHLGFDRWDSHREMLLRASFLEHGIYDLAAMGSLTDKNYLGSEKVYNQGFDFLRYLSTRFGEDTASRIAREAGTGMHWSFKTPLSKALGVDADVLFADWRADRQATYSAWLQTWGAQLYEGSPFLQEGFLTQNASISPDGRWLTFTGNEGADFPTGELFLLDLQTGEQKTLFRDVGSPAAWLPDGSAIIVSADGELTWNGYSWNDLYRISIPDGKTTRLTRMARAEAPHVSPDGQWLTASVGRDGRRDIAIWRMPLSMTPSSKTEPQLGEPRTLTRFVPGVEAARPRFSPDGEQIVFQVNVAQSSDIWMLRVTDATLTPLIDGPAEDISPVFLNAHTLAYISDARGAFDLYTLDLTDRTRRRWTTSLNGVFDPAFSAPASMTTPTESPLVKAPATKVELGNSLMTGGAVATFATSTGVTDVTTSPADLLTVAPSPTSFGEAFFSVYHDGGFVISQMTLDAVDAVELPALPPPDMSAFENARQEMTTPRTLTYPTRRYYFDALPLKLYPEFLLDNGSVRAGATLALSDVLGKHQIELEVLIGQNQDYHLSYTNRQWHPDIIMDLSRYVRRNQIISGLDATKLDFTFDAAMVATVFPFKRSQAVLLSATGKRIDFGYPVDRTLQRGFDYAAQWTFGILAPSRDNDINPTGGRIINLRGAHSHMRRFEIPLFGSTLDGYEVKDIFWTWTGEWTEYISIPGGGTIEAGVRGGYISHPVSLFDQFYLGGRLFFLRQGEFQSEKSFPGYEEFAIAGEKLALTSLAYRHPLWRGNVAMGPLKLASVFGQVFGNAGNALPHERPWSDFLALGDVTCPPSLPKCRLEQARRTGLLMDVGTELRLKSILFDAYAWNSFARVAYGIHEPDPGRRTRFYVGLGIGY